MGNGATIADIAISALSVVGSLAILGGFAVSSQRHHIRQKIVCALGVMDLMQSTDVLAGSINELRGNTFVTNSASCNASGFFYQFSVFGSACLTLVIAGVTFASLAHPLSTTTARLEHPWTFPVMIGVISVISFVPALALTLKLDLVDVRGVCWFRPNTNASNLTIFVPRAFVLVCVIVVYGRLLLFFLRRDMKLFGTNSVSQTGATSDEGDEGEGTKSNRFSVTLPRRMSSWTRRSSNGSNAQKSDVTMVKGHSSTAPPTTTSIHFDSSASPSATPPYTPHALSPSITTPSYSPHVLSTIPASPNPGESAYPFPQTDHAPSVSPDSSPDLENFLTSANTSRRPSDQPSALSRFRIDDTTSSPNADRPTPRSRVRRARGQLSPRQVNRRLSVLLMLYPLAYALLIAVSLARLIQQLATKSKPPPALANISRWLIYSQGLIDGLLFVVIRWVLFNFGR